MTEDDRALVDEICEDLGEEYRDPLVYLLEHPDMRVRTTVTALLPLVGMGATQAKTDDDITREMDEAHAAALARRAAEAPRQARKFRR